MPETLVVDCSVAAKWILPEPGRASARRLLDRYVSGDVVLIAPEILLFEFASLVSKHHRRNQISATEADEAFVQMTLWSPRLFDTRPQLYPALRLSLEYRLSLWDCLYLALALEHDCPMITADERLFRGGSQRHPSIRFLQ
jgi:predicted nucleic acid-binding protein